MPALSNGKHEAFAQAVFSGKNGRQAYLDAGYECTPEAADAAASRLLKDGKVSARILELRERVANKTGLSKSMIVQNVLRLAGLAEEKDQLAVAKECWKLLGSEFGAFTEKKNVTIRRVADLSTEEIQELLNEPDDGAEEETQAGSLN